MDVITNILPFLLVFSRGVPFFLRILEMDYWYYDKEYRTWRKLKNRLGFLLRKKLGFLVAQEKCDV